MSAYEAAARAYGDLGVDCESAIAKALSIPISVHCWQADDVGGFELHDVQTDSGGIMATGSYPGKAHNADEVRQDLDMLLRLVPGVHRANLHAIYAETNGKAVGRDALEVAHFSRWIDWAKSSKIGLDFNPTYFAHPLANSGYTLSHADSAIRDFWVSHGIASRRIAMFIASELGSECVNNHWIPDGEKDHPADRWSPRSRLIESYDRIFTETMPGCVDAVESKLFGLGSEDYVVGSFEICDHYAIRKGLVLCLDMGHFHPTESVADKMSALLQFHERLLLHTSRPMRWDSDHVVLWSDDLRNVFLEVARGGAMERVIVALDYFDASINRIAAYVIGIRATRKALLYALLDPCTMLARLEILGKKGQKLAWMEEIKTYPFGEVWNELCRRADVPIGGQWINDVETYECKVLASRS